MADSSAEAAQAPSGQSNGTTPVPSITPAPAADPAAATPIPAGDAKPTIAGEAIKTAEPAALFDPKAYKAPEGSTVDEKTLSDYAAIVNDDKLSPSERGTKMLDLYNSAMKTVGESYTKAWTDTNEKWVNEVKADPEIGGSKFEPTKQMISKAIDTMGPAAAAAFRQSLDITGVGNNPAFIRGLAVMAKALTEGSHVAGGPPSGKEKSVAEIFYPSMNQKDS